jgi:hypothetical protein
MVSMLLNMLENKFARSHPTMPVVATGGATAGGVSVRTKTPSHFVWLSAGILTPLIFR